MQRTKQNYYVRNYQSSQGAMIMSIMMVAIVSTHYVKAEYKMFVLTSRISIDKSEIGQSYTILLRCNYSSMSYIQLRFN